MVRKLHWEGDKAPDTRGRAAVDQAIEILKEFVHSG